jgi:hypothetical protein
VAYNKNTWKDRVVANPMTFTLQNNPDGTVTLIPAEGEIIEQGTPITANNMNSIEQGIADAVPYSGATQGVNLNKQDFSNVKKVSYADMSGEGNFFETFESSLDGKLKDVGFKPNGSYKVSFERTIDGIVGFPSQSALLATSSTTQSITAGVTTKVTSLGNKLRDNQSEFASSRFTAKENGIYLVRTWSDFGSGFAETVMHKVYINSSYHAISTVANGVQRFAEGVICISLNAGDYVEFYIDHASSSAKTLSGAALQVVKLT